MPKMIANPKANLPTDRPADPKFGFRNGLGPVDPVPVADFKTMADAKNIKIIITVDEDGRIMSYNHPNTPDQEKLKNQTKETPYILEGLWDGATITLLAYKEGAGAELGYWKTTSGGRIMIT